MKIPAIRSQIGVWVYYIATLTFKQVSDNVKKVDTELHKSELLSQMLQRSITENYKSIANYIVQQEERFFNSLVLAVYDGDPQWNEFRLEFSEGEEFFDIGYLEFNGSEKIFPVDGQHRVEGIKKVVKESGEYDSEKIPVIFIGHKRDDEGMQRARRMFSTLNRYAKPVSLRDIIALDEDDSIALACRDLIDNNPFFTNKRILDSKNKSISGSNSEFTTIITLYECNKELLTYFLRSIDVKNSEGKKIRGKSKLNEYIRFRPTESNIAAFIYFCNDYWNILSKSFIELIEYSETDPPNSSKFRNCDGGSLLFRPTALLSIVKVSLNLKGKNDCTFKDLFTSFHKIPFVVQDNLWQNILWNPAKKTMLTTNSRTTELLMTYIVDSSSLTLKELNQLKIDLQSLKHLNADETNTFLENINE